MSQPWWAPVVQWTLWGIFMAVVMGWVARSRHRPRPESDTRRLVHPPSTLIIGLVGFGCFFGVAVISNLVPNSTADVFTTSVFLGFAALSLLTLADYFLTRHEVSDEGMHYGSLTGRRDNLTWSEVTGVRYAPAMKWFRLEASSGKVARISVMLVGLPEFARLVLAHAPPTAIEPETLPILEATRGGQPPSVWG